jgi:prolipoprotein diacylglyceryl transferase
MYATLYDLIRDLTGLKLPFLQIVNTFGLLVAISVAAAYQVFQAEFRRRHKLEQFPSFSLLSMVGKPFSVSDYVSSAVLGFIMGYKLLYLVIWPEAAGQDPAGFLFSGAGSLGLGILVMALVLGLKYREDRKQRLPVPEERVSKVGPEFFMGNITAVALLFGFLGAKIFHIFEDWTSFLNDPFGSIFSTGGWTFYGGLIGGGAAVLLYCRTKGMNLLRVLDVGAPGLMLSYALGRLGCHLSGDGDWGVVNTTPVPSWMPSWMWSYRYPNNVIDAGIPIPGCDGLHCFQLEAPVFPTPLYEFMAGLLLFAVIWFFRKKLSAPGLLFCLYMILAGVERWLVETIRVNTRYELSGLDFSQAQLISVLLILLGSVGAWYLSRRFRATAKG